MNVNSVADIRPKLQAFASVAFFFIALFSSSTLQAAGLLWLWHGIHGLAVAILCAPSVARIIVEVKVENRWFFSRALLANLAGISLILFFIGVGTAVPLEQKHPIASGTYAVLFLFVGALTVVSAIAYLIGASSRAANRSIASRRLRRALSERLDDGVLDDDEFKELEAMQEELGLDRQVLDEARNKSFQAAIRPVLKKVQASRRMSPEQEEELRSIASDHQVTPNFGPEFQVFRQLYDIETTGNFTPVPIANPGIRLTRGEECYLEIPAIWKQLKRFKKNTGYVGGSVGFRVAKGVTLRVGKAVPTYKEYEELQTKATGHLYLTNKKIVFVGDRQSTNVTFGRLASYSLARDAIEIQKTSGKPDVFFSDTTSIELLDAHLQVVG